jgi:hypothetical protein
VFAWSPGCAHQQDQPKTPRPAQKRGRLGFLLYVRVEFHCLKGFFTARQKMFFRCPRETSFGPQLAASLPLPTFAYSVATGPTDLLPLPSQYLYSVDFTQILGAKERVCGCLPIYFIRLWNSGWILQEVCLNLKQSIARFI